MLIRRIACTLEDYVFNRQVFVLVMTSKTAENPHLKVRLINLDINKPGNEVFLDQLAVKGMPEDSDVKVEISIIFLADINWQKEMQVVQINIVSKDSEQSIQTDLGGVEEL